MKKNDTDSNLLPKFKRPFIEIGAGWKKEHFDKEAVMIRLDKKSVKEIISRDKKSEFIYLGIIENKFFEEGTRRPSHIVAEIDSDKWS